MSQVHFQIHSSLEKLFPHSAHLAPKIQKLSGLWGETVSFQISFHAAADENRIFCSVSVKHPCCKPEIFVVEQVPCSFPCAPTATGAYLTKSPTLMPDPLIPYTGKPLRIKPFLSQILWVDLPISMQDSSGDIEIIFSDRDGNCIEKTTLPLTVIPTPLTAQKTQHSEWFYADCLCDKHNCEMFSDEFFEIAAKYFRLATQHSVDTLLTPVFTPSLDIEEGGRRTPSQLVKVYRSETGYAFDFSLFHRWVEVAKSCGIQFFEIAPFFTQWGAKCAVEIYSETEQGKQTLFGWDTPADSLEYANFLKQFLCQFMPHLHQLEIADKTFFHVSDEPYINHIEQYQTAYKAIAPYIENCPILDALREPEFYRRGLVNIPVVAENFITPFLRMKRTGPLWTYCCCSQDSLVPNFFMAMPSSRGRILGILLYLEKLDGFLRWGFNFWHSQFSIEQIDPYRVTDSGMGFPSGDAFLVYPPKSSDQMPVASLRLKTIREAFQDKRALDTLEQKIGRDQVVALIYKHLGKIRFSRYPSQTEKLLSLREEINQKLMES